jgi:hypothetical protein
VMEWDYSHLSSWTTVWTVKKTDSVFIQFANSCSRMVFGVPI